MTKQEISTNYLKFIYSRLPYLLLYPVGMCSGGTHDEDKNDLLDLLLMPACRVCSYDMLQYICKSLNTSVYRNASIVKLNYKGGHNLV